VATPLRFTSWTKALQAIALVVAVTLSMGAGNDSARFQDLSHRLMCTCGCAQMLGECNQMGCAESARAKAELTTAITSGKLTGRFWTRLPPSTAPRCSLRPPRRDSIWWRGSHPSRSLLRR